MNDQSESVVETMETLRKSETIAAVLLKLTSRLLCDFACTANMHGATYEETGIYKIREIN